MMGRALEPAHNEKENGPMNSDSKVDPASDLQHLRRAIEDGLPPNPSASPEASRLAVALNGDINQTAVAFNVFASLMATDGIRAALYSVLRKSDYRFISIFRFKDGKATSSVHVDRNDLNARQAAEVADTATYCCYVRNSDRPFATADATTDSRTADHPAREVVRSYVGIPIFEPEGGFIGTLCHYDLVPRDPRQLDLELLLQVSSALARSGEVPPYPDVS